MLTERRNFIRNSIIFISSLFAGVPSFALTKKEWDVTQSLTLLSPGQTIDLNVTLPPGMIRGGNFSIAATSTKLPLELFLSAEGLLTMRPNFSGQISGIIFEYEEPKRGLLLYAG